MPTTTRFSVAKTKKSYSAQGVDAVLGSTVKSETDNGLVVLPILLQVTLLGLLRLPDLYRTLFGGSFFYLLLRLIFNEH